MSAESSGVFTLKEINRVKIIQDVIERRMTTRRAAEHLGISDRQCRSFSAKKPYGVLWSGLVYGSPANNAPANPAGRAQRDGQKRLPAAERVR